METLKKAFRKRLTVENVKKVRHVIKWRHRNVISAEAVRILQQKPCTCSLYNFRGKHPRTFWHHGRRTYSSKFWWTNFTLPGETSKNYWYLSNRCYWMEPRRDRCSNKQDRVRNRVFIESPQTFPNNEFQQFHSSTQLLWISESQPKSFPQSEWWFRPSLLWLSPSTF